MRLTVALDVPKIVQALRRVNVIERFDRLDLNHDTSLHQQICNEVANHRVSIPNFNPVLLRKLQTALAKLEGERILIDFLEKTGTQDLADAVYAPDDSLGNFVEHQSAVISVC